MTDMRKVTEVDSTQINADDLISGPQTFTITNVKIKGGKDQPVEISLRETDKFFRPCKTVCRVMVAAWGPDSTTYKGKSFTLYCDPKVRWGGLEVGGLRISHMSHLDSPLTMALTVTRGSKKPYTVKPLKNAAPQSLPGADATPPAVGGSDGAAPFSEQIKAAKTLVELGEIWKSIPSADKEMFVAAKDARKAELTKPESEL